MSTDYFELLYKFKEQLKVLNRSPNTIASYCRNIETFWKLSDVTDVKAVDRNVIEKYAASLYDYRNENGEPYKTFTICLKIRAVKRFFGF